MARQITKELGIKIAKKLKATVVKGGAHDIAYVFHQGQLVAEFGIRHGSEKDQGHDHIPRDLHLGPNKARLLGQCPLKREQWIQLMAEQGLIDQPQQPEQPQSTTQPEPSAPEAEPEHGSGDPGQNV